MANPSGLVTGIDNNGQLTNAYITASWPSNPVVDNVVSYELRLRKTAGDLSGTASGVTATTLTDSTANWTASQWKGCIVVMGTMVANVLDNTATQLTLDSWSTSQPALGSYVISHITVARSGGTSYKFTGLYQGTSYGIQIRAINNIGQPSGWAAERTITTASDSVAPDVPGGFTMMRTAGGAVLQWTGVDTTQARNSDLKGYEVQVAIGTLQGGFVGGGQIFGGGTSDSFTLTPTWVNVTSGGYLGTSFAYTAPRGTPPNTQLAFRIRSVDWSGNVSAWATATPIQTEGTYIDHLLAGTLKVFGTLSATGGFSTRQTNSTGTGFTGVGYDILGPALTAYDGGTTDHGYGPGVTFKVDATTGNASLAGDIRATGIVRAAAFIGDSTTSAPSFVAPSTGFTVDPSGGFNWYKAGVLQAKWASNGALTIYSGAAIYASVIAPSASVSTAGGPLGWLTNSVGIGFYANGAPSQTSAAALQFYLRGDSAGTSYSQQAGIGLQDGSGSGGAGTSGDLYVMASGRIFLSGYAAGGIKAGGSPQVVVDSVNGQVQLIGPTVPSPLDIGATLTVGQSVVTFTPTSRSNNLSVGIAAGLSPTHTLHLGTDDAAKTTTTTWTTTSDARLKRNVSDFTLGLDAIRRVRPVEFEWDADHPHAPRHEGRHVGVLAQEIAEVVPHSIRKHLHIDEEGKEHEYLGFTTHELIFVLVNAVKELDAKLAKLQPA